MTDPAMVVYATESYAAMADAICGAGADDEDAGACPFTRGHIERDRFPDGERYQRITTTCTGHDVVVVAGTISDADTLELYDLACGLVACGAHRLSLVIPFFGYSTMERAVKPGEVVTAKTRARLLSSIPAATVGNRVFLVDLHVDAITHYFEGSVRPVHVYAKPVIQAAARRLGGERFVLACTDAGRAKWVESLASELGVDCAFVYKRRIAGDTTEVTGVSAHVAGRAVVIYDDMIRTGGSLLAAARAYRDAGATRVAAVTTHALLPGDALARIAGSGLIDRIACTDTHPRADALRDAAGPGAALLEVDTVAPLLARTLREVP